MLKNKVALVTGASSGIGRAIALLWAREGAKVVVSDVNVAEGEETAALVRAAGGDAIFVAADVGKPADCEALVNRTVAHYGRLDVACNNAGIGGPQAPTADYPLDGWAQVININLSGVFYGMKYQIAAMLKNGGGSVINMASILGSVGFAMSPAYTAAKHGVVGLTKAAALEYSAQGVRVNGILIGLVESGQWRRRFEARQDRSQDWASWSAELAKSKHIPLGRLGLPQQAARALTFLVSPFASYTSGSHIDISGGHSRHA